jgi:hypothetical protein
MQQVPAYIETNTNCAHCPVAIPGSSGWLKLRRRPPRHCLVPQHAFYGAWTGGSWCRCRSGRLRRAQRALIPDPVCFFRSSLRRLTGLVRPDRQTAARQAAFQRVNGGRLPNGACLVRKYSQAVKPWQKHPGANPSLTPIRMRRVRGDRAAALMPDPFASEASCSVGYRHARTLPRAGLSGKRKSTLQAIMSIWRKMLA